MCRYPDLLLCTACRLPSSWSFTLKSGPIVARYLEDAYFFMHHFLRCWLLLAVAQSPDRATLDKIFTELAETTGFTIRRPVSFEVLSRGQVNKFLDERLREAVRPAEVRAEELTLKKLGFVPADFDLKKTTIALLTEQTAAFYDYHRKKLYLTDWASTSLRDTAMVHEMAHALADQNFSLERFAKRVENDSEQAAARQAVVEGQASWLMAELGKRHPQSSSAPEEPFPVFDSAPLYLRETLTFPYTYGTEFQQALFARWGKLSFSHVFKQPPISTQQILHPELYFSGKQPVHVTLPNLKKMHRLVGGELGELEHSILLRQFTTDVEARAVSPHWRGARYQLWEDKRTERVALVYRSAWDTDEAASQFFGLYRQVLNKKLKGLAVSAETANRYAGKAEDGYFAVELTGAVVTSREGLADLNP